MYRKPNLKSFLLISIIPIIVTGCAAVTHTTLNDGGPSAKLNFELLTANFAGGGHLGLSTDPTCKKTTSVFDYTIISDFRKGHTFRADVDKFEATIPAGKEVQLYGRSIAPNDFIQGTVVHGKCDRKIIFTPEVGANYYVTYAYRLPGCELKVYKISDTGSKEPVEVKGCS